MHDLPYMFLLMVGVALVRKPGVLTSMVFVNYLIPQLLFGSGHGALDRSDGGVPSWSRLSLSFMT